MYAGQLGLYANKSGRVLSAADELRELYAQGMIEEMAAKLDASEGSTTLCCVSPKSGMLSAIADWIHDLDGQLVSIGSGSGLFERMLAWHLQLRSSNVHVFGVDVAPIDVFLRESFDVVQENRQPAGLDPVALLAVYIRRPSILISYLEWFPHVKKIVLLGPRNENPLLDEQTASKVHAWGKVAAVLDECVAPWDILQILVKHAE